MYVVHGNGGDYVNYYIDETQDQYLKESLCLNVPFMGSGRFFLYKHQQEYCKCKEVGFNVPHKIAFLTVGECRLCMFTACMI